MRKEDGQDVDEGEYDAVSKEDVGDPTIKSVDPELEEGEAEDETRSTYRGEGGGDDKVRSTTCEGGAASTRHTEDDAEAGPAGRKGEVDVVRGTGGADVVREALEVVGASAGLSSLRWITSSPAGL